MKKHAWALTALGLALSLPPSAAYAGGWHGYKGHGNCGGYSSYYYGHSSNDAAIVAATLFGTAALVNALTVPRYSPPPVVYYPPPPAVAYYPAPVAYYPPPPPVYYPRVYYRPY